MFDLSQHRPDKVLAQMYENMQNQELAGDASIKQVGQCGQLRVSASLSVYVSTATGQSFMCASRQVCLLGCVGDVMSSDRQRHNTMHSQVHAHPDVSNRICWCDVWCCSTRAGGR